MVGPLGSPCPFRLQVLQIFEAEAENCLVASETNHMLTDTQAEEIRRGLAVGMRGPVLIKWVEAPRRPGRARGPGAGRAASCPGPLSVPLRQPAREARTLTPARDPAVAAPTAG